MRCENCEKNMNLIRKSQWVSTPDSTKNKLFFCSSDCYMEHEDSRVKEPFKLFDSPEEEIKLREYQHQRGYF